MKKICVLFLGLICLTNVYNQGITLITSLDGVDYTFNTAYNNSVLMKQNVSGKYQLVKVVGSKMMAISNPDAGVGFSDFPIILKDALYFRYKDMSGKVRLGKYDNSSVSLLTNPVSGDIKNDFLTVIGDSIYGSFTQLLTNNLFASDGSTIRIVKNPTAVGTGVSSKSIIKYKDNLYSCI